jgi:hypothetical protein
MRWVSASRMEPKRKRDVVQAFGTIAFATATLLQGETESTMSFERQKTTLTDRLGEFVQNVRDKADKLEPGPERQALLDKARQAESASEFTAWADSPGLHGPK